MKHFSIVFILLFSVFGCSNDRISPINAVEFFAPGETPAPPAPQGCVGPVPEDIAVALFDRLGTREQLLTRLLDLEKDDPHADEEFLANWLIQVIAGMDHKHWYYNRYIDAGGIAIIGNEIVPDEYFIAARDIVLKMTSKRPDLRDRLTPESGFYLVLAHIDTTVRELPENYIYKPSFKEVAGECGLIICYSTVYPNDKARYPNHYYMKTFVHEFAHAIHMAIVYKDIFNPLDPNFEDRLKAAYKTAMAAEKWQNEYASTNYAEYWAEGVLSWYYPSEESMYFNTREEFAEYDPLLYALIAEWFDADDFRDLE